LTHRRHHWDAATYDRVSGPQVAWAERVLQRLPLTGDETVLDAGCGSGRVTRILLERLPRGRVIAVDGSESMVEQARASLGQRATVLHADLTDLVLEESVDAVFSNAVFHWVLDHDALFARLRAALRDGGWLVAQCGGAGNVERFLEVARRAGAEEPFAAHLARWEGPWNFATAEETEERLRRAGFSEARTWLEPSPVVPESPREYLRAVCLGPHLERLPEELHDRWVAAVADACGEPLELDYMRLNIDAVV
jgi:trans-aconitate 2-methyltransferase